MGEIIIRNAVLEDGAPLAELSTQLGYSASTEQILDRLAPILASEQHAVFSAQLPDGLLVGWLHVFGALRVEADPFAEIGGFVVREGYRGQGIGSRLLGVAESWAVSAGFKKLRVRTRFVRTDTHGYYRHMGFVSAKEQKVFDKPLVGNP